MNKELRPEILTTARRMFNDRGYNDVSMRDIAGELGISVGNLTYHYRTKKALVEAVVLENRRYNCKPVSCGSLEELDAFFLQILLHQRENIYYFRHYRQLAHLSETVYHIQVQALTDLTAALEESFQHLREHGAMEPEDLSDQTGLLIDAILSVFIYGTLHHTEQRGRCVWSLIYPLLTEEGKQTFTRHILPGWEAPSKK